MASGPTTTTLSGAAVRLLQGYLWVPREIEFDPRDHLPSLVELRGMRIHLLLDPVSPPFAFFDDGTPAKSQRFFQFTALVVTGAGTDELRPLVAALRDWLAPRLATTPEGVGWLLLEDLRSV